MTCSQYTLTLPVMEKNLGEEIREMRIQADFTLRAFAKKIDISAAHLSDIEHGRRLPSDDLLERIVDSLAHVGATWEGFKQLDTRIDAETKKWLDKNPGAQQILRISKESGKSVHEIIQILKKSMAEPEKDKKPDEG